LIDSERPIKAFRESGFSPPPQVRGPPRIFASLPGPTLSTGFSPLLSFLQFLFGKCRIAFFPPFPFFPPLTEGEKLAALQIAFYPQSWFFPPAATRALVFFFFPFPFPRRITASVQRLLSVDEMASLPFPLPDFFSKSRCSDSAPPFLLFPLFAANSPFRIFFSFPHHTTDITPSS